MPHTNEEPIHELEPTATNDDVVRKINELIQVINNFWFPNAID